MTKSIKKQYHKFVLNQQHLLPNIYQDLIEYRVNVNGVIHQKKSK